VWAQLAPGLQEDGLLTPRTAHEFAAYCQERAIYIVYSRLLKELKPRSLSRVERYRSLALKAQAAAQRVGARFGLTPSDQVTLVSAAFAAKRTKEEELLFGPAEPAESTY